MFSVRCSAVRQFLLVLIAGRARLPLPYFGHELARRVRQILGQQLAIGEDERRSVAGSQTVLLEKLGPGAVTEEYPTSLPTQIAVWSLSRPEQLELKNLQSSADGTTLLVYQGTTTVRLELLKDGAPDGAVSSGTGVVRRRNRGAHERGGWGRTGFCHAAQIHKRSFGHAIELSLVIRVL
jgi:hypothetical protein